MARQNKYAPFCSGPSLRLAKARLRYGPEQNTPDLLRSQITESMLHEPYTASWATTLEDGSPYTWYATVRATEDPSSQIPASTDKIIVPATQPGDDLIQKLDRFERSAPTAALEAVMLEDGSTIGRDTSHSMDQVKADIKAERDLFKAILAENPDSVLSLLQKVSGEHKPGTTVDLSHPFSAWYRFEQSELARVLLRMSSKNGVSAVLADIQKTFYAKQYPVTIDTWGGN